MPYNFTDLTENGLLNLLTGGGTALTVVTPLKMRLCTSIGNDTTAGTEVSGGSYPAGGLAVSFSAATASTASNSAQIDYTGMPATTVVAVELWDQSGTPKRIAWAPLSASKTVAAGDTMQFAVGSITLALD